MGVSIEVYHHLWSILHSIPASYKELNPKLEIVGSCAALCDYAGVHRGLGSQYP
jgi:hypothetical protein